MKTDIEKHFREDLLRAAIPPGFRPVDVDALEKLLDTASAEPFSADTVERILGKMRGTVSLRDQSTSSETATLTEKEQELLALHRNCGGQLPPEIQRKIDAIKKKLRDARDKPEAVE